MIMQRHLEKLRNYIRPESYTRQLSNQQIYIACSSANRSEILAVRPLVIYSIGKKCTIDHVVNN